jgi:hypothetical protein
MQMVILWRGYKMVILRGVGLDQVIIKMLIGHDKKLHPTSGRPVQQTKYGGLAYALTVASIMQ